MATLPSPNSEIGRGHVCTFVREEVRLLRRKVKEKASLLLKQNIHVDSLCLRVLKYVCNVDKDNNNDCLELSDVFKSIWSLSEDDKEEERLFTSCVKDVVESLQVTICMPLVRDRKLYSSKTQGGNHEASWILKATPSQNRLQGFEAKLACLAELLEFCARELSHSRRRQERKREC